MMLSEALRLLVFSSLWFTVGTLVVLASGPWMRRIFGAPIAYSRWLIVPLTTLFVFLPVKRVQMMVPELPPLPGGGAPPLDVVEQTVGPSRAIDAFSLPISLPAEPLLILLWGLGFTISIGLVVIRNRRLNALLGRLRHTRMPNVWRSENDAVGPIVTGLMTPKIIVPASFEQLYTAKEQQLILAHEEAHRQAADPAANTLAAILRALFWFNPLAYVATSVFHFDQEAARDAAALTTADRGDVSLYARALIHAQSLHRAMSPSTCRWTSQHPLTRRIEMLSYQRPGPAVRHTGTLVLLSICAALISGAWVSRPKTENWTTVDPHAAFTLPSDMGFEQRFPATSLAITGAFRINLIPEERHDVFVGAYSSTDVAFDVDGSTLFLTGPDAATCLSEVEAAKHFKTLVIRVPNDVILQAGGSTSVSSSSLQRADLVLNDCASLTLHSAWSDLTITMTDRARLSAGRIASSLNLVAHGASRATIGSLSGHSANLSVLGASTLRVAHGNVDRIELELFGAGSVHVSAEIEHADLQFAGAVHASLGSIENPLIRSYPDEDGSLTINGTTSPPPR